MNEMHSYAFYWKNSFHVCCRPTIKLIAPQTPDSLICSNLKQKITTVETNDCCRGDYWSLFPWILANKQTKKHMSRPHIGRFNATLFPFFFFMSMKILPCNRLKQGYIFHSLFYDRVIFPFCSSSCRFVAPCCPHLSLPVSASRLISWKSQQEVWSS